MIERVKTIVSEAQERGDQTYQGPVDAKTRSRGQSQMALLSTQLDEIGLPLTRIASDRLAEKLKSPQFTYHSLGNANAELMTRLVDELGATRFFCIEKTRIKYYEAEEPQFGKQVEAKFPAMSEDISEAGKCLAFDRPTAAVFHLMRVMELALQRLGTELGVSLVTDKNWQNILDEANKAIKALDHKLPHTKALAEATSHLYAVKLAWRNEVMHPKQTYTTDQAEEIYRNVQTFVRDLAGFI